MTDITESNAQVVVYGEVATNAGSGVSVVIPQLMYEIEGAVVTLGNPANNVSLKTAISGLTLTITPASTVGTNDVYRIVAWGY